jgi:hypothetical protein
MIHWEQSFNCESTGEMYEQVSQSVRSTRRVITTTDTHHLTSQFTRQALLLPSRPIVLFSHSATDNWRAPDCKDMPRPHSLTDEEKGLLAVFHKHRPLEIFTSVNKIEKHFHEAKRISDSYLVYIATVNSVNMINVLHIQ